MRLTGLGPQGKYTTRLLEPPDIPDVQSLFERTADYFEMATGVSPADDEAKRAFVAGPPTKSVDDKRIIGVFDSTDSLVGMLDALVDFPADDEWTMGMLLIDPEHRGAGLGKQVLAGYESWAAQCGARKFHTALVSHHDPGIRFLERSGYVRQRVLENDNAGGQQATVVFFAKTTDSEPTQSTHAC
ncbi:MAG: GNAT family N-acetyltransferase [Gemmatimonadetes bacterium]|nr:GNAT family N-acetyltransferase [Gemmatimonadota bacterium]